MEENESRIIKQRYKRNEGKLLIEVDLVDTDELFDDIDPSPLRQRDLHSDIATYIKDSLRELPNESVVLKIYFEKSKKDTIDEEKIPEAVQSYFDYEANRKTLELKRKLKNGSIQLMIGLTFLFICSFVSYTIKHEGLFWEFTREGLTLLGWVSMWGPIQVFLYEWWPILAERRVLERARQLRVQIVYW